MLTNFLQLNMKTVAESQSARSKTFTSLLDVRHSLYSPNIIQEIPLQKNINEDNEDMSCLKNILKIVTQSLSGAVLH